MKKNTNPLDRQWRHFKSPYAVDRNANFESQQDVSIKDTDDLGESYDRAIESRTPRVIPRLGGIKPSGLGKYHNKASEITKRFNTNVKNNQQQMKAMNKWHSEFEDYYTALSQKDKAKIQGYDSARQYSEINRRPARPGKYDLNGVKNRRLGTELSRIISKIAEDYSGTQTEGDDFWDIERLMLRSFNNEPVTKCRMSYDKSSVVMMLDSSPSCSEQSNFYSKLAVIAAEYGDLELYDAPNGRLVHMWSPKQHEFVKFLTPADVLAGMHKWSMFKNRVVMFFGDTDGCQTVFENTVRNKVFYFYTEREEHIIDEMEEHSRHGGSINPNNLTIIPSVVDMATFMNKAKKMK